MTLNEAIKHCEEVAEELRNVDMGELDALYCGDTECIEARKNDCIECADEHRQLGEWLKELKQLREQEPILGKIKAEIGMYEADCRLQGGTDECKKCNSNIFGSIYRIIDKYSTESEGNE